MARQNICNWIGKQWVVCFGRIVIVDSAFLTIENDEIEQFSFFVPRTLSNCFFSLEWIRTDKGTNRFESVIHDVDVSGEKVEQEAKIRGGHGGKEETDKDTHSTWISYKEESDKDTWCRGWLKQSMQWSSQDTNTFTTTHIQNIQIQIQIQIQVQIRTETNTNKYRSNVMIIYIRRGSAVKPNISLLQLPSLTKSRIRGSKWLGFGLRLEKRFLAADLRLEITFKQLPKLGRCESSR